MRIVLILIGILAATAAGPAVAGPRAVPPAQAMKAATGPGFPALAEKTRALAAVGDASGLAGHLAAMKADPALDTPTRERLLYEGVQAAGAMKPDTALRDQVAALAGYRTETLVWTDEHGHREVRPLFDLAVATRQVQRIWAEQEARSVADGTIGRQDTALVAAFATAPAAQRAGTVAAVREAGPAELLVYQPTLIAALDEGQPVGELAAAVAGRTHDSALMSQVLSSAPPDVALRALMELESDGWAGHRTELALIAARRTEIASAALLAIGRIADTEPRALDILFEALGGPDGASAAAALARIGSARTIERFGRILRTDGDDTRRRHALLGLRLAATPAARAELAAFASDPASPIDLIAEVPAWLRD